jgi:hypothetical protein
MIITSMPVAGVSHSLASTVLRAATLGLGPSETKTDKREAKDELVDMRLDEPVRALLEREFRKTDAEAVVQDAKVRGRGKQEHQYTVVRTPAREIVLLKIPASILQDGTRVGSLDLISYVLRGKTVRIFSPDLKTSPSSWFNGLKRSWQREPDNIDMEYVSQSQLAELEQGEGDLENVLLLDLSSAAPPVKTVQPAQERVIEIFLASSEELSKDRNDFELYFRQRNDHLRKNGLYLKIIRWENFLDAMSETRLQDEYNKAVRSCDIFVCLFFTKTGKFTEEEFDTAHRQFELTRKPLIYTFFKKGQIDIDFAQEADLESLKAFKKKLKELNHYYTSYESIEHLNLQFRDQLDLLPLEDIAQKGAQTDDDVRVVNKVGDDSRR